MPLLTFQIAALSNAAEGITDPTREYNLDALQGTPIPASPQIQDIDRPGTDYHGLRVLGRTGPPFQMLSVEYTETLAAASEQLARYHLLKGDSVGVKITHRGLEYYPADVVSVDWVEPPYEVANVAGSLTPNPGACLRCQWVLRLRNAVPEL